MPEHVLVSDKGETWNKAIHLGTELAEAYAIKYGLLPTLCGLIVY